MKKIGVLYGGPSKESEISNRSSIKVYNAIVELGYNCERIEFSKDNITLLKQFDLIFNIMHGSPGEDGVVQGLLESMKIPYTGSGVLASAITINKYYTQSILKTINIPVLPSLFINSEIIESNKDIVKKKFKDKVIIKHNKGGSSIGTFISDVDNAYNTIMSSIDKYNEFIVEEYIEDAQEITVGIIEYNNKIKVLTPLELVPKNKFYDFNAKYTEGKTEFILPPRLSNDTIENIKSVSLEIFKFMNLKSFARIDYIVKDNKFYELEINSIPGMTELSDLPAEAEYDGISYNELINYIINTAGVNKDA